MLNAGKRIKLSNESSINKFKNESHTANSTDQEIESGFHSQIDFTNNSADFSLPPVKRKSLASRQISHPNNKKSLDLVEQQTSLGYSSLLSSPANSSRKSQGRSPRKRKAQESDENAFYNSYQFVSPLKISKRDSSTTENYSKRILKEKSSSENVILSSTPIRNNNKNKWGRFRSLHPEKFSIGKSTEDNEPIEKLSFTLPKSRDCSFDCGSSFDFSNSFNLTSSVEQQDKPNIPNNLHQLCTASINLETIEEAKESAVSCQPTETTTQPQPQEQVDLHSSRILKQSPNTSSCSRKIYFNGRAKVDILRALHREDNLALPIILNYMTDTDLLSLSHVSKDFSIMITSNKALETKRQNYLKSQRENLENKFSGSFAPSSPKRNALTSHKRAFGDLNVNHSMQLRSKPPSPPVSPSRKRFVENQKIALSHKGLLKKCPRCFKPAKVKTTSLRTSPRKKKKNSSILKISTSGRIQKRSKTFLSSPSIGSCSLANDDLYVTFPMLEDSPSSSSSGSPSTPTSDDSCGSGNEAMKEVESYEYAECTGLTCKFKFCVKCNCKYHPRAQCKDFSPVSPPRGQFNKSSVACSSRSLKSLKRLIY